jgi:hypothetical protein
MWEVPHPPSAVEFSSHCHFHKLSCSKVAGRGLPLLPSLANLFIYCSMRDCPFPPLWHSRHPALFATCLFCCCLFGFFSFSCFPGWESACPGVYADLAQDCLWEYHVPLTSPGGLRLSSWYEMASGGVGALLVCPFTMEYGCYGLAGAMEE